MRPVPPRAPAPAPPPSPSRRSAAPGGSTTARTSRRPGNRTAAAGPDRSAAARRPARWRRPADRTARPVRPRRSRKWRRRTRWCRRASAAATRAGSLRRCFRTAAAAATAAAGPARSAPAPPAQRPRQRSSGPAAPPLAPPAGNSAPRATSAPRRTRRRRGWRRQSPRRSRCGGAAPTAQSPCRRENRPTWYSLTPLLTHRPRWEIRPQSRPSARITRAAGPSERPRPRLLPITSKDGETWLSNVLRDANPAEFCQKPGRVVPNHPEIRPGTYSSRITSPSIRSLAARRSGGRGPAKNGLPEPSTTGWR